LNRAQSGCKEDVTSAANGSWCALISWSQEYTFTVSTGSAPSVEEEAEEAGMRSQTGLEMSSLAAVLLLLLPLPPLPALASELGAEDGGSGRRGRTRGRRPDVGTP